MALVAALLTLAVTSTLAYPVVEKHLRPSGETANRAPSAGVRPDTTPIQEMPTFDLAQSGLQNVPWLVTPLDLSATSHGLTVNLIGAYADAHRTVFFLRTEMLGAAIWDVSDEQGRLTQSSAGTRPGSFGDQILWLNEGPRVGPTGVAHLTLSVHAFNTSIDQSLDAGTEPSPPPTSSVPLFSGDWTYVIDLTVYPAAELWSGNRQIAVGAGNVTIEAADVTPSVVNFQARIEGKHVVVTVLDSDDNPVAPLRLIPNSDSTVTASAQWTRPTAAESYTLRITGDGGRPYSIPIAVPALPVSPGKVKGISLLPQEYPEAAESLQLAGAWSMFRVISSWHPSSCGTGAGAAGRVFAFAAYFQDASAWYLLTLNTDPAVVQYRGPGTYSVQASILSVTPIGAGPALFAGQATLRVVADGDPSAGSVRGSLHWTVGSRSDFNLNISGTWTCRPGLLLGPG